MQVIYEQLRAIPRRVKFLLTLTFKTPGTQANSFCPKSHFNGTLCCSHREVMGSRRLKCDRWFPCDPADATLRLDRGKECNKAHAQYLEEMSLRSLDLLKTAGTAQVWPDLQSLQHTSYFQPGLNSWDKKISQRGSIQDRHHWLCLECCLLLFTEIMFQMANLPNSSTVCLVNCSSL